MSRAPGASGAVRTNLLMSPEMEGPHIVVSLHSGCLFRGPNNKDHNIMGSLLGSPYFGKLPYRSGR